MKVVINTRHGGFGLSPRATRRYWERKGRQCFICVGERRGGADLALIPVSDEEAEKRLSFYACDVDPSARPISLEGVPGLDQHMLPPPERADPDLVAVVEELGASAAGKFSELKVVEIPDGVEWGIEDYDGREWVAERHRTWS